MSRKISVLHLLLISLFLSVVIGCSGGGSSTETGNPSYVGGLIQKGPFYKGATVVVRELNDADLQPSGVEHVTQIVNGQGAFALADSTDISSRYAEIRVTGRYYNEVTGFRSLLPVTLMAFVDLTSTHDLNANILTTIALKREKYLMVNDGKTYTAAKLQARNEILTALRIPEGTIGNLPDENGDTFVHMDIAQDGVQNAILLSLSVVLSGYQAAPVSYLVQTIGNDIETDGVIDDAQLVEDMYASSSDLDTSSIRTNLNNYYASISAVARIPWFEYFLELFSRPYVKTSPPVFSLPSATYNHDIALQLYTIAADADIYYTINDGAPVRYTLPIDISGNQTVAKIDAWTVKTGRLDSDPVTSYYFVDYDFDPAQYRTDMSIGDYQSNMVGTWVGYMEPPASYLSPDNIIFTIDETLQYTTRFLSYYCGDSAGLYMAYMGWVGSELYYGTEADYEDKQIEIHDLYPDGSAAADVFTVYNNGGSTILSGELDHIAMSDDLNHMQFEFMSNGLTVPINMHLTRLRE